MERLALAVAMLAAVGCAHERGTCVKAEKGYVLHSKVKAEGGQPPTHCATLFFDAATPPKGLSDAAVQGGDAQALAAVKLAMLATMHAAKGVPFVGGTVAPMVGRSVPVAPEGTWKSEELEPGSYVLEVACAEGWDRIELVVPEPPRVLRLRPGANLTVTLTEGEGPFTFRLFKDHALSVIRGPSDARSMRVTGLPPGRYLVGAIGQAAIAAAEVELREGESRELTLVPLQAENTGSLLRGAPTAP